MLTLNRPPYILVLDDEPSVCDVIARWLQGWGYSVMTAHSAEQALMTMTRRPPAMVVADLVMPGDHDGLWLIEQIHTRWPAIPVIVESGAYSEITIRKARALGAVDFLPKPFVREQLHQAMIRAAYATAPVRVDTRQSA